MKKKEKKNESRAELSPGAHIRELTNERKWVETGSFFISKVYGFHKLILVRVDVMIRQ